MFCVFVAGWRHALRSEWPFIISSSSITGRTLMDAVKVIKEVRRLAV